MTSNLGNAVVETFFQTVNMTDLTTMQTNLSGEPFLTSMHNISQKGDCIEIISKEMDYVPWDNPDNIVSAEVETIVHRIKNNLIVLLFLIGGPANVINMAVFFKQGLKDRVHLCLFALAVADELHLIMSMLSFGEQLHLQFTTKERFGPILTYLANKNVLVFLGSSFVSHVLSAVIATERCLCVLNPLRFQHLLRTRTMGAVILTVNAVIFGLTFFTVYRYRIHCIYDPISQVSETTVVEGEFYRTHKAMIDLIDSSVFGVGLPCAVIVVVLTTTIITSVKLRHAVTWRSGTSSSLSPREIALTKMLVANSIFFIICVTPEATNRVSWLFLPEMNAGRRHHNFFHTGLWIGQMFMYTNASFNIVLYYTMGSRYRETFWALLRRKSPTGKA